MWKKYLRNSGIYTVVHKQKDSALWSDMLHVIKTFTFVEERCKQGMGPEPISGVTVGVDILL
jgi:hypothetical protein